LQKPKAISLFSGAGGMDLGFNAAGFDILASVEIDPACCDTLRQNLRNASTVVMENDVRAVTGKSLCDRFGLSVGELDCLFGGPPCQSFSLAGDRAGLSDERGKLLFEFFRLVDELRPKVFVLENVKGILNWSSGAVVKMIYELFDQGSFNSLPYKVEHRCLNAVDYGAPQYRERAFFVGNRLGKNMTFPSPTHGKGKLGKVTEFVRPVRTVGDSILDLPAATPPSKMASRVSQTIKGRIARHGY
jgi:DNA (cytosine-5)-methyltransferase 1